MALNLMFSTRAGEGGPSALHLDSWPIWAQKEGILPDFALQKTESQFSGSAGFSSPHTRFTASGETPRTVDNLPKKTWSNLGARFFQKSE